MKSSLDELVSVLDRLVTRLDELESRIATLEHRSEELHPQARSVQNIAPTTGIAAVPAPAPQHPVEQMLALSGGGAAAVIGKVFLGIAGGYVLRALAESGVLPQLVIVAVALAYAGAWLVWGARMGSTAKFAG